MSGWQFEKRELPPRLRRLERHSLPGTRARRVTRHVTALLQSGFRFAEGAMSGVCEPFDARIHQLSSRRDRWPKYLVATRRHAAARGRLSIPPNARPANSAGV